MEGSCRRKAPLLQNLNALHPAEVGNIINTPLGGCCCRLYIPTTNQQLKWPTGFALHSKISSLYYLEGATSFAGIIGARARSHLFVHTANNKIFAALFQRPHKWRRRFLVSWTPLCRYTLFKYMYFIFFFFKNESKRPHMEWRERERGAQQKLKKSQQDIPSQSANEIK